MSSQANILCMLNKQSFFFIVLFENLNHIFTYHYLSINHQESPPQHLHGSKSNGNTSTVPIVYPTVVHRHFAFRPSTGVIVNKMQPFRYL